MRAYAIERHYLRNTNLIEEIKETQMKIFQEGVSPSEAIADAMSSILTVYSKIRKVIKTSNIIQIEHISDEEITVIEFNAKHDIEVILFINEDSMGNKYLDVPKEKINKKGEDGEAEFSSGEFVADFEVVNRFYDEDGHLVDPEEILKRDLMFY